MIAFDWLLSRDVFITEMLCSTCSRFAAYLWALHRGAKVVIHNATRQATIEALP